MKSYTKTLNHSSARPLITVLLLTLLFNVHAFAQTAPPPALGENTKGEPALDELKPINSLDTKPSTNAKSGTDDKSKSLADNLLGEATITESRRESGQVYQIELEHSSGSKQYIDDADADGQLTPDNNAVEDTPNIAKWKLGSW